MAQSLNQVLRQMRAKYPRATYVVDDVPDDNRTLYEGDLNGILSIDYLQDNKVLEVDESQAPDRIFIRIEEEAIEAVKSRLLPRATLVTPNIPEAEILSGLPVTNEREMELAARRLFQIGCRAVLIKGGHLEGAESCDLLFTPQADPVRYTSPRIATRNTHGTGCTFSSAIASYLALGHDLPDAVAAAKTYLTRALEAGADVTIGHGHGAVNHLFAPCVLTPRDDKGTNKNG